jgi:hypothetical protein
MNAVIEKDCNKYIKYDNNIEITYSEKFVNSVVSSAYYEGENSGFSKGKTIGEFNGFVSGYLMCYSDILQNIYIQEGLDMTNSETFEMIKSMSDKIDNINEKVNSIDKRLVEIEVKEKLTWKSKQLWIPVLCSIIVAILGAFLQGKIHF